MTIELEISALDPAGALDAHRLDLLNGLLEDCRSTGTAQLDQLNRIRAAVRAELWRHDGARNAAEWVSAWVGCSNWKARRMIACAFALPVLPRTAPALANGSLHLDKVVELTRFATPKSERKLVLWAKNVSPAGIQARADEELRLEIAETKDAHGSSNIEMYSAGERWFLNAELPLEDGVKVEEAIRTLERELPSAPSEEGESKAQDKLQREADALVAAAMVEGFRWESARSCCSLRSTSSPQRIGRSRSAAATSTARRLARCRKTAGRD